MSSLVFVTIIAMICLVWGLRIGQRHLRRVKLLAAKFPQGWFKILQTNFPLYCLLPSELQEQLQHRIVVFVGEKNFEGCAGLEITDEIKVTIAAQACLLLLNRGDGCYPKLDSVLVYPNSYLAEHSGYIEGLNFVGHHHRLGESSSRGFVVLSWDAVLRGASDINDGSNLVFHEFAHQLDQEDGAADGLPILDSRSHYQSWARILIHEYAEFVLDIKNGRESMLDEYGATNPAEFFAVLTETFYEKPESLKSHHPELFEELQKFYKVNPLEWRRERSQ